ncbi:hypothetical protein Syn7502_02481 [Synechococcus sp. PCC 7502]|nr:hypothetical protein Syn7502_02481 [Synechococcus sp. PCC 7502]
MTHYQNFDTQQTTSAFNGPIFFSNNGFSYNISVTGPGSNQFFNSFAFGSPAISLNNDTDTILVSFTSGNITAVGGDIFTSNVSGFQALGNVTVNLNDGTSVIVPTTSLVAPAPFRGFISDKPITSLSLTANPVANSRWPTLDNFYVGATAAAVPFEFNPALGLVALGGLWGVKKLRQKNKS